MQVDSLNKPQFMFSPIGLITLSCSFILNGKAPLTSVFGAFSFQGAGSKCLFPARLREYRELRATKEWIQEAPACHDLRISDQQLTEVKGFHEWMQSKACQRSGRYSLGSICGLATPKKRISNYYPFRKNGLTNSGVKPN